MDARLVGMIAASERAYTHQMGKPVPYEYNEFWSSSGRTTGDTLYKICRSVGQNACREAESYRGH